MTAPIRIAWATQSYKLDSEAVSNQRAVNCYAEREPPDAKTDVALFCCPGVLNSLTVGSGGIRGFDVMNDVLYVVSGQSLYSVSVAGQISLLGTGIGGFGPVSMANNGLQVIIVNGVSGWVYAPVESYGVSAAAPTGGGGSGYQVGDTYTVAGGVSSLAAVLVVTSIGGGGAVTGASVQTSGVYTTQPSNPVSQAATSGVGTGAELNLTFVGPPVGFTQITDPNFPAAFTVFFFDSYFVVDVSGTNQFRYSAILDGTTWPALQYYSASVQSAFTKAVVNQQENLLIFTAACIETWYDTGTVNNPFTRYDGATIERGCAASLSVVKEDNAVFFLGNDLVFYRLDGVTLSRKSTHAIEKEWLTYPTVSDAFAFSYTFGGHKFVAMTFPSANATWEYDIATNLWHERVSYIPATPLQGVWRVACAVMFNNQLLAGDANSGGVGVFSGTTYTEFGSPMIGQAVSPPVHKNRIRLFGSRLEINMQTGVGLPSGQGSNPQVMLEISKDQGHTWGLRQLWQSMGKIGAYATRLLWKKLGKARDWRFRVTISDPVPRTFVATYFIADEEETQ